MFDLKWARSPVAAANDSESESGGASDKESNNRRQHSTLLQLTNRYIGTGTGPYIGQWREAQGHNKEHQIQVVWRTRMHEITSAQQQEVEEPGGIEKIPTCAAATGELAAPWREQRRPPDKARLCWKDNTNNSTQHRYHYFQRHYFKYLVALALVHDHCFRQRHYQHQPPLLKQIAHRFRNAISLFVLFAT